MPKRFAKRRSTKGGKRRVVRGRRRLSSTTFMSPPSMGYYATAAPQRSPSAPKKKRLFRRGRRGRGNSSNATAAGAPFPGYRHGGAQINGKNTVPTISRGSYKRSGSVKRGIRRQIMEAMVYGANPVLRSDVKSIHVPQPDWSSGQQSVTTILMANSPQEIEKKFLKCRDASYFSAAVAYPTATSDVTSQRMVVFPTTFILNMKNTCSHTIYVEGRVFKAKGYHGISMAAAWNEALANDNLVQNTNAVPYPTEENVLSLYKRPDMKMVHLNCRFGEIVRARSKWVLEPGQESKFIFKMPGFTYDQAKYNVTVMGSDPTRCPQSYELQLYCHSEMVTGALDNDVCPGSGHMAINQQLIESWQGLPIVKKYQNIASYGWGDIIQADEQDVNTDDVQPETYFENE